MLFLQFALFEEKARSSEGKVSNLLLRRKCKGFKLKQSKSFFRMALESTGEIRVLLSKGHLDFELVVNKALNNYLPKIFHFCPLTEDLCKAKQCLECFILKEHKK